MLKPHYLMIGGFLGAGKTTAILQAAGRLQSRGLRVGLITNDQSTGLVDTALLDSHGFATEEITGGCFCCKFNSLIEAAQRLTAADRPDVFLAEPVGSCTDLRATVTYPLRRLYGEDYVVGPLSVLVDPLRAQRILALRTGKQFSAKVIYIYEKQLEEADLIVINKTDLLSAEELEELTAAIAQRWPQAATVRISARTGAGLDDWLERITGDQQRGDGSMEVDYDRYAEGEALLGWLNLTAELQGAEFDGNLFLGTLAARVRDRLTADRLEIAHLKMTFSPSRGRDIAVVNVVGGEAAPELSHELAEPLGRGELLLNLRAEGDPDRLRQIVLETLQESADSTRLSLSTQHIEAFRPGRPVPTHRLAAG